MPRKSLPPRRENRSATLFDAYLFVDWSGASSPCTGKNSIWIADSWFDGDRIGPIEVENPPTRRIAEARILERLLRHRAAERRVLSGFDFAFAFPAEVTRRLFGSPRCTGLWSHLACHVLDGPDNANNRFEVAARLNESLGERYFWSCPEACAGEWLETTKRQTTLDEYRIVERALRSRKRQAFSVRQVFGHGNVGGQSLVGIPVCDRLRTDRRLGLRVWPFETGLRVPARDGSPSGIVAEIWPGALAVDLSLHEVKDGAQVISCARWAATEDVAGTLGARFAKDDLDESTRATVESSEGWVLGA